MGHRRLLLLPLLITLAGCFNGPRVATYLTSPPNTQYPRTLQHLSDRLAGRSGARRLSIPVGPPAATLDVLIFEPGQYASVSTTRPVHARLSPEAILALNFKPNKTETRPTAPPARDSVPQQITFLRHSTTRPVASRGTIVLLHGYSATKETLLPWAVLLAERGYRCVLVDLRCHGHSSGDVFSFGKYETADMMQVLDALVDRHLCEPEVAVMGWSFGADLALFWGARDPRVKAIIAIAPYDRPQSAATNAARHAGLILMPGAIDSGFEIVSRKLDINWSDWTGAAGIRAFHGPVLLVSATKDAVSTSADIRALAHAATTQPAQFGIGGGDHLNVGLLLIQWRPFIDFWLDRYFASTSGPAAP